MRRSTVLLNWFACILCVLQSDFINCLIKIKITFILLQRVCRHVLPPGDILRVARNVERLQQLQLVVLGAYLESLRQC